MNAVRQAVRQLIRHPGTTLVATLALALGIGLATFIFSFVNSLLFKTLPFDGSDQLFVLELRDPKTLQIDAFRAAELPAWRKEARNFEAFGGFTYINTSGSHTPDLEGATQSMFGSQVTANFLDLLRVRPLLGRGFLPGEDQPDGPRLALLSYRVWQRDFGGDPGILNRTIRLDGEPATVIGVMPEGFRFPFMTDIWTNLRWDDKAGPMLMAFVRLRPGVTPASARAELDILGPRLAQARPNPLPPELAQRMPYFNQQFTRVELRPFLEYFDSMSTDRVAWALLAMGFCVLLIACGNATTLLSARAAGRVQELAVRAALGASRGRLIGQMLLESAGIAALGATAGLALSLWGGRVFWFYLDQIEKFEVPFWFRLVHDWRVFGFVALALGFAGLVSGLVPALRSARLDVHTVLNDGPGSSAGLRLGRLGRRLVIAEIALALPLLVLTGVVVKTVAAACTAFPAGDPSHLLTARLEPAPPGGRAPGRTFREFEELTRQLESLPGVESAALSERMPTPMFGTVEAVELEGQTTGTGQEPAKAIREVISPGYFRTLEVNLLQGRDFAVTDQENTVPVAIVNRAFARKHWPDGSPLGRRIRRPKLDEGWLTVVGVVPDLQMEGMYTRMHEGAGFYLPQSQHPLDRTGMTLFLRVQGNPLALARPLQDTVRLVAPGYAVRSTAVLSTALARAASGFALISALFVLFGLAATVLAGIGVAGILSFTVTQRTSEFGIRLALGATRGKVLRLVLRQTGLQVGLGLGLGLGLAWTATRLARSLFVAVSPYDLTVYGMVLLAVATTGLMSAWLPARRATRLNPATALRHE